MTLSERLAQTRDRPAGFDYMRLFLACSIVAVHCFDFTRGPDASLAIWHSYWRLLVDPLVPAFFALSGFLVAGSLERCKTIGGFLYLRLIRIFPALVVEILLSALILGPLMTEVTWSQYLSDPAFRKYLLNCLGIIHFSLPGLFLHNPVPGIVNRQLWTIPFELKCYVTIGILGLWGITRSRRWFMLTMLVGQAAACVMFLRHAGIPDIIANGHGQLVLFFLVGVYLHRMRAEVPYSKLLFAFCLVLSIVTLSLYQGYYIATLPLGYVVVYLGLTNPPRLALLESGDYSYGIYLYGVPVQQAIVASGLVPLNPWMNFVCSFPIIVAAAVCSWHCWEKHVLKLRKYRPAVDTAFGFTAPGVVARVISPRLLPAGALTPRGEGGA